MSTKFKTINTGFIKYLRAKTPYGCIEIDSNGNNRTGKYKATIKGRYDPTFPRFYFSSSRARLEMLSFIRMNP